MSPGLTARPSSMFSVAPTRPITRTGAWSSASAPTASITAAPPHMSNFISCIPAAGLSEIPPESNVTALPISAISGAFRRRRRRSRGGSAARSGSSPVRPRRTRPSPLADLVLVEHRGLDPVLGGQLRAYSASARAAGRWTACCPDRAPGSARRR